MGADHGCATAKMPRLAVRHAILDYPIRPSPARCRHCSKLLRPRHHASVRPDTDQVSSLEFNRPQGPLIDADIAVTALVIGLATFMMTTIGVMVGRVFGSQFGRFERAPALEGPYGILQLSCIGRASHPDSMRRVRRPTKTGR